MVYDLYMTILNTFAKRIRLMRSDAEMSQQELVQEMGRHGVIVSQGHWSRVERGHATPSSDLVMAAAKVLGVSADYLLCLSEDPHPRDEVDRVGISEEAEEVASLVDAMSPSRRQDCMTIARSLVRAEQESRSMVRERAMSLLNLVRAVGGEDAYRQALDILGDDIE